MKKFFSWRMAILKSDLSSSAKLLLLTLSCHMNDAGESCFPSVPLLAKETSMNSRTIYRQLALCEQLGWITIKKMNFKGAQWARNSYTISWPPDVDKLLDLRDDLLPPHRERGDTASGQRDDIGSGLGVTQDQGRGDTVSGLGVTQDHPISTGINSTLNSPTTDTPVQLPKKAKAISAVDVERVFEHWRVAMESPGSKLDTKRETAIKKQLKAGYTVDQLCVAITGCSLTPHNMGQNDNDQKYNGLSLILRDAEQIDRFTRNALNPPNPKNGDHSYAKRTSKSDRLYQGYSSTQKGRIIQHGA